MNKKILLEGDYIKYIFKEFIHKDLSIVNISLKKITSSFSKKVLQTFITKLNSIVNQPKIYIKKVQDMKIYNCLLYLILFILESNNYEIISLKGLIIKNYIKLVSKLYFSEIIGEEEINNLCLFIIHLSFIDRKNYSLKKENDMQNLKHHIIKFYDRFKISIDLVIEINNPQITKNYIEKLIEKVLVNKSNYFLLNSNTDILNFLHLRLLNKKDYMNSKLKDINDGKNIKNDDIINLLIKIYSFHYNKNFLNSFFDAFKNTVYNFHHNEKDNNINNEEENNKDNDNDEDNNDENENKNNESLNYIFTIERYIELLVKMSKKEENYIEKDTYMLNNGFVFNENRDNGISVKNVIIQSNFSLIFSFSFQPEKNNDINNSNKQYPLINLLPESNRKDQNIAFYIEENKLYYFNFDNKIYEIAEIEKQITYLICYNFIQNSNLSILINSDKLKKNFNLDYKINFKKSLILYIGKYNYCDFEGYIGPILLFNSDFSSLFYENLINLKGSYEKILYYNNADTSAIDKYDRNMNYIIEIVNNNIDYISSVNYFKKNKEFIKNILCYIAPPYEISNLNKKTFVNYIFKETKVNYSVYPIYENAATFFFKNTFTIFEFVKYEGINYLILNIEIILSNLDKKLNKNEKKYLIIFYCNLIDFSLKILITLEIIYFTKEIKSMMFTVEKSIQKV